MNAECNYFGFFFNTLYLDYGRFGQTKMIHNVICLIISIQLNFYANEVFSLFIRVVGTGGKTHE